MKIESEYTVVGTSRSPKGIVKVRWTCDYISHSKRVHRKGCTDINFYELPEPMTKLESLSWLLTNGKLNEEEMEIVLIKRAEKRRKLHKEQISSETV
jgi:hypothetical protein